LGAEVDLDPAAGFRWSVEPSTDLGRGGAAGERAERDGEDERAGHAGKSRPPLPMRVIFPFSRRVGCPGATGENGAAYRRGGVSRGPRRKAWNCVGGPTQNGKLERPMMFSARA